MLARGAEAACGVKGGRLNSLPCRAQKQQRWGARITCQSCAICCSVCKHYWSPCRQVVSLCRFGPPHVVVICTGVVACRTPEQVIEGCSVSTLLGSGIDRHLRLQDLAGCG